MKAACAFFALAFALSLDPSDVLAFEGRITAVLTRGGETQTVLYTVGASQMRIERAETNWPYAKNIVERESGAVTLVFPHNRSFVRLKPAAEFGSAQFPGPAPTPLPPARLPPGIAPQPIPAPGTPVVPSPLPPAQPLAPGDFPPGTRPLTAPSAPSPSFASAAPQPAVPAMPTVPPVPMMPREQLDLKATDQTTNLLGYTCTRYELKQGGAVMEIWATDQLLPFQAWLPNQTSRFGPRMLEERWADLLKAKKLFPLLAILRIEKGPERLRFEIKEIKPTKIDDPGGVLFKPPADYHEIDSLPF
jgi:hypothetical protein